MANTYVDYTATAAQTDFAFSFDYLEDEHVTVEIDGVVQLTSDYSIVTSPSTKVVLNVGATAGQIVRVRRKSQPDTNLVDFVNGSVLTESELDRAYLHNRYLAEEISELNDQSLQVEAGGTQWDAKSLRIKNVGTTTDTTDAATKDYVDAKVNQVSSGASSPPTKWVFTGTAGANTTYSVTGAEVNGDTAYDVSIDGAVKEPTTDYTVDPDTDTLTIVPTLSGGEDIVVIERGFGVAVTGTIGSSQIQADAVDGSKIADDSIDSEHYVDGSIDTAHIANNQITAAKISTTDPIFNVQSTGEVSIGTTSPTAPLTIDGSPYPYMSFDNSQTNSVADTNLGAVFFKGKKPDGTVDTGAAIRAKGAGTATNSTNDVPAKLVFATNPGGTSGLEERMVIDDDGNVGIGTTPSAVLHVAGNSTNLGGLVLGHAVGVNIDSLRFYIDSNNKAHITRGESEKITILNDGSVGIGTTSPSAPLEVDSTTGGLILPRLTDTEMNAISNPTNGEIIYNTTRNQFWGYANGSWQNL